MAIDPQRFKAPYLENTQCWDAAEIFRHRYWPSGALPVDVLDIAEFDLGLKFKMVSGLREDADVDALLLGDWQTLAVDQKLYLDAKYYNRLRFSIAHELGHFALHKEAFKMIARSTVEEWISYMKDMPEDEYG